MTHADLIMELHRRLGHPEQVIELAQQRLLANPYHVQSLAALAWAIVPPPDRFAKRRTRPRPPRRDGSPNGISPRLSPATPQGARSTPPTRRIGG